MLVATSAVYVKEHIFCYIFFSTVHCVCFEKIYIALGSICLFFLLLLVVVRSPLSHENPSVGQCRCASFSYANIAPCHHNTHLCCMPLICKYIIFVIIPHILLFDAVQCACFSYANIASRCHNTSHQNTQDTMLHAFHMQI